MSLPELFLVFDCESVGLHGETFAVGWVVVDRSGRELAHGRAACHPDDAEGSEDGRQWVRDNVPASIWPEAGECGPIWVREQFWLAWREWNAHQRAVLVADCAWPVEARFLARCVDDSPRVREWQGPYPLIDVASVRLAAGLDPLATVERLPGELPVHDPLADARQSARLLIEALTRVER
jgi:hypothetical protein